MRKLLYIVCLIGVLFSLPSCERNSDYGNGETFGSRSTDSSTVKDDSTTKDSAAATKGQNHNIDSVAKAMSVSLKALDSKIENVKQNLDSLNNRQEALQKDKISYVDMLKSFALLVLVMVLIAFFLFKQIVLKERKKQTKELKTASKGANSNKRETLTDLELKVLELSKKVGTLEKSLKDEKDKWAKVGPQPCASKPTPSPAPTPTAVVAKRVVERNVFYMKRPHVEKEFDLSLKSESPNEDTFYRFQVDPRNHNMAHFFFDCKSEARVRWAFSTKDQTLDLVCNVGGVGRNGTFECTTPGEARLEGGKWIVTRKAVVIFS